MDAPENPGTGCAALRCLLRWTRAVCLGGAVIVSVFGAQTACASALQTLHSFGSNPRNPQAGLVQGRDGNFYGAASLGGSSGENGTVFRINTLGLHTTLFSFNGTNGSRPLGTLVQGTDANLYGTTAFGGTNADGAIFKITTNGVFTSLFSFNGTNGRNPAAGLVQATDGNFYGTAQFGGTNADNGTIFRIRSNGVFTALFSFPSSGSSGSGPAGSLVQGTDGQLYGTTTGGGAFTNGTVFRITTNGVFTLLFSFRGTNGSGPAAALIQSTDTNFYGTTQFGGTYDNGTVFRMTPAGVLTSLYSFRGPDGNYPLSPLVRGTNGNFYGTSSGDQPFGGTNTFGTVFRMTPAGALTTLIVFGGTNGASPVAGLARGNDHNLYGTTFEDGAGGGGTIFRVVETATITRLTVSGGNATLTWTSFSNGMYRVEYKPALSAPGWSGLFPDVIATGNTASITDQLGGATQRFYRVRLLP